MSMVAIWSLRVALPQLPPLSASMPWFPLHLERSLDVPFGFLPLLTDLGSRRVPLTN